MVEGAALKIRFFRYSPAQKLNMEAYRSGHNGPDSKSCGELSVLSSRNLVTMRVLPGSKIE